MNKMNKKKIIEINIIILKIHIFTKGVSEIIERYIKKKIKKIIRCN